MLPITTSFDIIHTLYSVVVNVKMLAVREITPDDLFIANVSAAKSSPMMSYSMVLKGSYNVKIKLEQRQKWQNFIKQEVVVQQA